MHRFIPISLALAMCAFGITACDSKAKTEDATSEAPKGADPASSDAKSGDAKDGKGAAAKPDGSAKAPSGKMFDKKADFRLVCSVFDAKDFAEAFNVPADEVKEANFGCAYTWESKTKGEREVKVEIAPGFIHKEVARAKKSYDALLTQSPGARDEEVAAALGDMKAKARADGAIASGAEEKAAKTLTGTVGALVKGITYQNTAQRIGDQSLEDSTGKIWVRLGNMTYTVMAYDGKPFQLDPKSLNVKDPTKIASAIAEASKAWEASTSDVRKKHSTVIANLVTSKL